MLLVPPSLSVPSAQCYRWVPLNPNTDNSKSWSSGVQFGYHASVVFCMDDKKFGWFDFFHSVQVLRNKCQLCVLLLLVQTMRCEIRRTFWCMWARHQSKITHNSLFGLCGWRHQSKKGKLGTRRGDKKRNASPQPVSRTVSWLPPPPTPHQSPPKLPQKPRRLTCAELSRRDKQRSVFCSVLKLQTDNSHTQAVLIGFQFASLSKRNRHFHRRLLYTTVSVLSAFSAKQNFKMTFTATKSDLLTPEEPVHLQDLSQGPQLFGLGPPATPENREFKKKKRNSAIKDMHCQPVLTFLWSPIEWQTFCQNSLLCYYFLWGRNWISIFWFPYFRVLPGPPPPGFRVRRVLNVIFTLRTNTGKEIYTAWLLSKRIQECHWIVHSVFWMSSENWTRCK